MAPGLLQGPLAIEGGTLKAVQADIAALQFSRYGVGARPKA